MAKLEGTVTLRNSVLDSLPTFVMSLLPIPASVVKKLNRLTNAIRKGGYNLVKWEVA